MRHVKGIALVPSERTFLMTEQGLITLKRSAKKFTGQHLDGMLCGIGIKINGYLLPIYKKNGVYP